MDDDFNPDLIEAEAIYNAMVLDPSRFTLSLEHLDIDQDEFKALRTDLERFDHVFRHFGPFPNFRAIDNAKNDSEATQFKNEANELLARGSYAAALATYTRCIADVGSKELLAILYANRSAALFKLGLYRECLNDINRAFANNYAGSHKKQLVERRKKATKALKPTDPYHEEIPQFSAEQKNPKIECASKLIEIKTSRRYGRHVVATTDIKFGDILAVERAYVCDLGDFKGTHCPHCLELCYDLIVCDFCPNMFFCSEHCKQSAYDSYHKYECKILGSRFIWQRPFILALRATFMAMKDVDNIEQLSCEDGEVYRSTRYKELHNLSTNKALTVDKLIEFTRHAARMFNLVKKHTSFFDDFQDKAAAEDMFKVVLMRQMQVVEVNKLHIEEKQPRFNQIYAYGLFPFYSLFNHSCSPNVSAFFYGSTVVLRAVQPIKKGEQCFVKYRYCDYELMPKNERQLFLQSHFGFKCKCRPCVEDWPMLGSMRGRLQDVANLAPTADPEIQRLSKRAASYPPNFRNVNEKLIALILQKLQSMEPSREGLYPYYQNIASASFKVLGNARRGITREDPDTDMINNMFSDSM